jgi:hypothetical protein
MRSLLPNPLACWIPSDRLFRPAVPNFILTISARVLFSIRHVVSRQLEARHVVHFYGDDDHYYYDYD